MEGGRAAIAKAFRQEGLEATEKLLEGALKPLKQAGLEELYTAVGSGSLSAAGGHARRGAGAAHPAAHRRCAAAGPAARPDRRQAAARPARPARRGARRHSARLPVTGLVSGMPFHFAGCCHPLPGERILGIVTTGKGVTIHATDCHTLENFAADAGALPRRRLGRGLGCRPGRPRGGGDPQPATRRWPR